MTTKDYLSQTWRVNRVIDAKLEQVRELRALAEKASSVLSHSPPSGTRNVHRMEDVITKLVDLEEELKGDISELVDLKREISSTINSVKSPDHRILLELRYLAFKTWEEIMADMRYGRTHTFRLHEQALKEIRISKKDGTKNS